MEWRAGLMPGEQVIVVELALAVGPMAGYAHRYVNKVATVKKRTNTQVVLSDATRWDVGTGREMSGATKRYSGPQRIEPFDAAKLAHEVKERERDALATQLREWPWREESLETLERVMAVLEGGKDG
jgi:hypothetical protein